MKVFDKIIIFLYSLIIMALSLLLIILPFNIPGILSIDAGHIVLDMMQGNFIVSILGLVIFVIVISYLVSIIKRGRKKRSKDSDEGAYLALENDFGEIVVYEETVIGLASSQVKEFPGIDNVRTEVEFIDGTIDIYMDGQAEAEINIPQISRELQLRVKNHVEEVTGAKVNSVNVEISDMIS